MSKSINKDKWSSGWFTLTRHDARHDKDASTSCSSNPPDCAEVGGCSSLMEVRENDHVNKPEGDHKNGVDDDDDKNNDGNAVVVTVPETGWYALYFGVDEPLVFPKKHSGKQVAAGGSSSCPGRFVLRIWMDNVQPKATEQPSETHLTLPLKEGNVDLMSSKIGKLIFLMQGARLQMQPQRLAQHYEEGKVTGTVAGMQWRVSFHRYLERNHGASLNEPCPNSAEEESNSTEMAETKELEQPALGALACSPLRRFCCSYCGQCFHNCQAVKQHVDGRHNQLATVPPKIRSAAIQTRNGAEQEIIAGTWSSSSIWSRPLTVLYQDDTLAVIDKPQGMPIMGSEHTLQRCPLLLALKGTRIPDWPKAVVNSQEQCETQNSNNDIQNNKSSADSILGKPRPVHRLDAATGGVLVVAKTRRSEAVLKSLFRERSCHKVYRALVYGKLQDEGVCEIPLDNDKSSVTKYRPLRYSRSVKSRDEWLTVVELMPVTGRRHQLRKHLQYLQHPIVGDPRYGGGHKLFIPIKDTAPFSNPTATTSNETTTAASETTLAPEPGSIATTTRTTTTTIPHHLQRLCLWALEIRFLHPLTGEELTVALAEEPEWLRHVADREQMEWEYARLND
ncbi:hypothetical protein ACA910_000324 [Epithemia clementina (nom. ined.)]